MTKHYDERKEANARYMAKFERVTIFVLPEEKENYRAQADQAGQSLTAYIKQAIEERIQRDQAVADHQPAQAPEAPVKPVTAQGTPAPPVPAQFDQEKGFRALCQTHVDAQELAISASAFQLNNLSIKVNFRTLLIKEHKNDLDKSDREKLDEYKAKFEFLAREAAKGDLPPENQLYYDTLKVGAQEAAEDIIKWEAEQQERQNQQDQ